MVTKKKKARKKARPTPEQRFRSSMDKALATIDQLKMFSDQVASSKYSDLGEKAKFDTLGKFLRSLF